MDNKEIALQITLQALKDKQIEFIKPSENKSAQSADMLNGFNAQNAQLVASYYKVILRELGEDKA